MISTYVATISSRSPLLTHKWSDANEDENATRPVHIGKRDPREEAEKVAYRDRDGNCFLPGAMFSRMLAETGSSHKQRGSRKSMKFVIPAAIVVVEEQVLLRDEAGDPISEFEIDSRPVVIPSTKGRIMRHRPRFNSWNCEFSIEIDLSMVEPDLIQQLLVEAGSKNGLGDWRPQKGGSFGRFSLVRWAQMNERAEAVTKLPKLKNVAA
jgi:hypothetical protein